MRDVKVGNGKAPPTIEERVRVCVKLVRSLKWRRGKTDKFLANHWGLPLKEINEYSAEAWRRVKAEMTDPDATAATVCVALERVIHEASAKGFLGHKSVIDASKTWAAIAGAGAPTRIEVGALANLSDAELDQRRREIILRLQQSGEAVPAGLLLQAREEPEESDPAAPPRESES